MVNEEYIIPEELLKTDRFFVRYRKLQVGGKQNNIPKQVVNTRKTSRKNSRKSSMKKSKKSSRKTSRKSLKNTK